MIITKQITLKAYILENLSQITIFAKMLNTSESNIEDCLNGMRIVNNMRNEDNASVRMKYVRDNTGMSKIRMTDFGDRRYSGDCFDIMGIIMGLNVNNNNNFIKVCKAILDNNTYTNVNKNIIKLTHKDSTNIRYTVRKWNKNDRIWTNSFGLTPEKMNTLVKIKAVATVYINNDSPMYTYNSIDPCYAYPIGIYNNIPLVKLYFPYRNKHSKYPRFITNNPFPFDNINDFKKKDILILIKSKKDNAVLVEHLFMIPEFVTYLKEGGSIDIRVVSSEISNITEIQVRVIQNLFDLIITNFDFDNQGCYTANLYRRKYGFIPIMLTNGKFKSIDYKAKDITDYRIKFGMTKTLELLMDTIIIVKQLYEKVITYK